MEFSVPMALVDFIPVFLFLYAALILFKMVYGRLSPLAYGLFAAGMADIFLAGFLKALYKLLYAMNICDFERLNQMFFPVQSLGFLMAGVGLCALLKKGKGQKLMTLAPAVFSGTFVFIALMVIGLALMICALARKALEYRLKGAVGLFVISFLCSLTMGRLASMDMTTAAMNWIAQFVNIAGQGAFLWAVLLLRKKWQKAEV